MRTTIRRTIAADQPRTTLNEPAVTTAERAAAARAYLDTRVAAGIITREIADRVMAERFISMCAHYDKWKNTPFPRRFTALAQDWVNLAEEQYAKATDDDALRQARLVHLVARRMLLALWSYEFHA